MLGLGVESSLSFCAVEKDCTSFPGLEHDVSHPARLHWVQGVPATVTSEVESMMATVINVKPSQDSEAWSPGRSTEVPLEGWNLALVPLTTCGDGNPLHPLFEKLE